MKTLEDYAAYYVAQCLKRTATFEEPTPLYPPHLGITERHIQALWFDPKLRPATFTLNDGRSLTIVNPGRWNLEAGPDFQDAVLKIDDHTFQGDVEVHIRPSHWDAHHHAGDTRYSRVILHVTWFDTPSAQTLPATIPSLTLQGLGSDPCFAFDTIHPSDYPYRQNTPTDAPCCLHLTTTPTQLTALLESAGCYRILCKANRFKARLRAQANDLQQIAYEEIMSALGYKQNTLPFSRLARDLPLATLLPLDLLQRFSLLAGTADLIPETNAMRPLWDIWWQLGGQRPPTPYTWTLCGIRPPNHPLRRLAAAATLLPLIPQLVERAPHSPDWSKELAAQLQRQTDAPSLHEILHVNTAFLGKNRINALINNVIVPLLLTRETFPTEYIRKIPTEDDNTILLQTLFRLTGDTAPKTLKVTGLIQQGLLQLFADFCGNAHMTCTTCPIPHLT